MIKPLRIALWCVGSAVALAVVISASVLLVARSDWLREKLRTTIIEQAEIATGGRVEIAKFQLSWTGLTADVSGLVIHGTEAPSQQPLLAVDHVTIGLRVLSYFTRDVRLARVEVTHPRVHLIIDANGGTNLPRPKTSSKTRTSDAILDLKIAIVDIRNGEVLTEFPGSPPHESPWSGGGKNLSVQAKYDRKRDRYSGDVAFAPIHFTLEGYGPLDVDLAASATMERNQVVVSKARLKTSASQIDLNDIVIGSFASPVATATYKVQASVAEAAKVLHWKLPISGVLNVTGNVRYVSPKDFSLAGAFQGNGLAYASVRNIRLTGRLVGTQASMSLNTLRASLLGGEATGSVVTKGYDFYQIDGVISGLGVRSLAALATTQTVPWDGLVTGPVTASGRISDLSSLIDATARLTLAPASTGPAVHGELAAHYTGMGVPAGAKTGGAAKLELENSWIELPNTRVDVSGTLGTSLTVKADSKDLNDLLPAMRGHALPFELRNGSADFTGSVNGALDTPRITGHVALRNAMYSGKMIDSATGDVSVSASQAALGNAVILYEGMTATGDASIALADWAATDASALSGSAAVNNVDLVHALAVAGYKDVPVTGVASVTARVNGTLGRPTGDADLTLAKGLIYGQPYDAIASHLQYVNADLQTVAGTFTSGPKRVTFDVRYPHAGQAFPTGTMQITASSNGMALNQIALVRERQPDIQGIAQFSGTASVRIIEDAKKNAHLELTGVTGDGSATGIGFAGRELGDAHISARTQGTILTASFDSNAAKATIRGEAKVELTGDDRTTGTVTFANAGLNALGTLIVAEADAKKITFDGLAEGQVDFSGPLFSPLQMSATATVRQIEVHPSPGTPLATTIPGFSLRNSGPVKVSYEKSTIRVDSAHFQAPQTDVTVSGTDDITGASALNLRLQGEVNLAMLRNFIPDLASSGTVSVTGNLRGSLANPDFSGHASIHGGEFHYSDFTNGVTNATGEIVFSGSRATIQSFNAETGGGKLTGSGFATLTGGTVAFQFSAKTRDVRLRYPQGISSISDSDIQLVRNSQRSSISGSIIVRRLVFNPQQDTAATLADLSHSASPSTAGGDTSLANMNLDVLIQTAPDVALQSTVAESIQGDATLRLRGTLASPALLGRINLSQGEVLFFGNKYTISRGAISFFNPTRIDPILDVDLQTRARGVDVTLTVTGSPSNLGMTYRSDPPLEFSDIVALLATGRTPDDPSVALRGNAPTPSFEQLGASALIGQTLANPVAGRLQRFFGVSRIKIDPQLAGTGGNPGARLTVEQQVTPDVLFTYITDVSNTSQQLIRVEWAFNRKWSAVLEREENGYVGLDFTYKKRIK